MYCSFSPPGQFRASALDQIDAEFDIERGFDAGTGDLAISLRGVAVAEVKERARFEDREVADRAFTVTAVIHIAAVLGGGGGVDELPALGGHPETPHHRHDRDLQRFQALHRLPQGGDSRREVEIPGHHLLLRQAAHEVRIEGVLGQHARRPAIVSIRGHRHNPNHQRIARFGAFDKERPGLGIAGTGDLLTGRAHAAASAVDVTTESPG